MAKKYNENEVLKALYKARQILDKSRIPLPSMVYLDGDSYELTWKRLTK